MTRWKAAAIHSSISAVVAVVTGALLFGVWYPPPYFHAAGADELILLLVGVDLAIGPFLTLIVFRTGKWGLKFDLVCIGLLQFGALIYGMSVILESRPIFLVADVDRFVLVPANAISDEDLAKGREPEFRSRSWTGPRLVGAELPTDVNERNDLVFGALAGHDLENQPKYFRHYEQVAEAFAAKAQPVRVLLDHSLEYQRAVAAALQRLHRDAESVRWVPLRARRDDMIMLIDARTAQPLKALAIDPWLD